MLITIDLETYYDRDYSLSKLGTEAYVRDPRFEIIGMGLCRGSAPAVWYAGAAAVGGALASFDWREHIVLAHNTLFDGAVLAWRFGVKPRFWLDTLSMARPVHGATTGVSLAALVRHYGLGVKGDEVVAALGKRLADFTPAELARYGRYCCNDADLTRALFHVLKPQFGKGELKVIDLLLRMFIEPVFELDKELLEAHLLEEQARKERLLARLGDRGREIIQSNPKFAALLRKLNVDPPMKVSERTGEQAYAFSKKDVDFLALQEHPDPRVQIVVATRLGTKSTIEETRTQAFIKIAERGTLAVPIGYYKAHTGRGGGQDGINLQNLPRGGVLRQSIRAPKGHVIVAGDSSNIEARVNAWNAGELALVEAFRRGEDVYCLFGSDVYERPITKADKLERFVAKTCVLGLGYGTGSNTLQRTLKIGSGGVPVNLPFDEAERLVNLYRRKYPNIRKSWNSAGNLLPKLTQQQQCRWGRNDLLEVRDGAIWLPNGMALRYPELRYDAESEEYDYLGRKGKQRLRVKLYGAKLVENIVQALARIIVFDQMLEIDRHFPVKLTAHDEVVCVVKESDADDCQRLMVQAMSVAPIWAPDLPVACEANIGATYRAAK